MEFEYFQGYPGRYRRDLRESLGCHLVSCLPLLLLAGAGAAQFGYQAWLERDWNGSCSLWFLLAWAILFLVLFVNGLRRGSVRILPYFDRRIEGSSVSTFTRGDALAPHCRALDERCVRLGLEPISMFGFVDEFGDGAPTFFDAARGIAVFDGLRESLQSEPLAAGETHEAMLEDLHLFSGKLREAAAQGIKFCLLLRMGNATSGHEMDVRKGSFF